jgi:3-hydroxymyristoyl/3-hydroxydecanoyl-(acyl carrier protein) dehydratase
MDLKIVALTPQHAAARLTFAADDPCCREHFPGLPILPGSLAAAALLHVAECMDPGTSWTIQRLRCLRFAPPGVYEILVRRTAHGLSATMMPEGSSHVVVQAHLQ